MKVATFLISGERRVGLLDLDNQTITPFDFTIELARLGILALIDQIGSRPTPTLSPIPLSEVDLEAPIPHPRRNIFCVGKNYHAHAQEFSRSGFDSSPASSIIPKEPIIFSKVPETVVATFSKVIIDPKVSSAIDYEAELAVIIGKGGKGISKEDALDHIWGYTIVNDVTARDLQKKYSQWLIGKSQDTFCPMGPWAVTKDEFNPKDAGIRCFVNGEIRQNSKISKLIFDIPTIISALSEGITLMPGDIIATGTPEGVGVGFNPPKYIKDGDVVLIEIDGIGSLENQFVESS